MDKILQPRVKFRSEVSFEKSKYSGCTRRETMSPEWDTQLRTKGYTFSLNQRESFLTQPKDGQRITKSREGNRDTPP